jgi:exodeoxyribonuclease V gamma subunit
MLHVSSAPRLDDLAAHLAGVLGGPVADPFAPEWIVVTTAGMDRWLRLTLSRHLGAGGPVGDTATAPQQGARRDGVAANLDMIFPGRLTSRVLSGRADDDPDPWHVERLAWTVLEVLAAGQADPVLEPVTRLPEGATRWGRARRVADLFDRYLTHRPAMVVRWVAGDDVDGAGAPIDADARWQPHLLRLVRARLQAPSPAELRPTRLAALRAGDCPPEVPERVALFGLGTMPGGQPFLEMLEALATQREVHLLLHQPSSGMVDQVRRVLDRSPAVSPLRADDPTAEVARSDGVTHPLLVSWARPAREALVLLGAQRSPTDVTGTAGIASTGATLTGTASTGTASTGAAEGAPAEHRPSLLARLQADLVAGTPPSDDLTPSPDDTSVRIHSCHGATRQVEVLRDQILHLLADDPTLTEDDVIVLCPAIDEFAPLIAAVWGPSTPAGVDHRPTATASDTATGPPPLSYRIADRSLQSTAPLLGAVTTLLDLLGGRFSAEAVLGLLDLDPVRRRFDLNDRDVQAIATWVDEADVRWGRHGTHREAWGVPAGYQVGTWRAALDRLLMGVAVSDDGMSLSSGGLVPMEVQGSDATLAGRLADLLARLDSLAEQVSRPKPWHEWAALLVGAARDLLAVDSAHQWQEVRLHGLLADLSERAVLDTTPCQVELTLADVRRLLDQHLHQAGGRPSFFRGGITVSSLTPLRGIPHRVVCVLGLDGGAVGGGATDGDDLTADQPHLGDRDPRADNRQALLDAVLAAGDHLVITWSGHNVVTNQEVPPAVPLAELRDVIGATLAPAAREEQWARIAHQHPRQNFDARNFGAPTLPGAPASPHDRRPWSFDPVVRDACAARGTGGREVPAFLADPLEIEAPPVIDLDDLRKFLAHPIKYFLERSLGVAIPEAPERPTGPTAAADDVPAVEGRDLRLGLDTLDAWKLKDRLLTHLLAGGDPDAFGRREVARGLPPGHLGATLLDTCALTVAPLVEAAYQRGYDRKGGQRLAVDVELPDGTRLVGQVRDDAGTRPGPIRVSPSRVAPKHRVEPWIDVCALTAMDSARDWWAVNILCRKPSNGKPARSADIEEMRISGTEPDVRRKVALDALAVAVDCYRRGVREPLPLFPTASSALQQGKNASAAWDGWNGMGDGNDEWVATVFGAAAWDAIEAIPARPDDPAGTAIRRARRYAEHLWGTLERSIDHEAPDTEGAEAAVTS